MAKRYSKDYIMSYADKIALAEEEAARAADARKRGFRLGTFKVKYMIFGKPQEKTVETVSVAEAISIVKEDCSSVGWVPYDINVETLVEPNIYV